MMMMLVSGKRAVLLAFDGVARKRVMRVRVRGERVMKKGRLRVSVSLLRAFVSTPGFARSCGRTLFIADILTPCQARTVTGLVSNYVYGGLFVSRSS